MPFPSENLFLILTLGKQDEENSTGWILKVELGKRSDRASLQLWSFKQSRNLNDLVVRLASQPQR